MQKTRVLLVDDHILFRKGLASLIASRDDMEVAGEAGDGKEALARAQELRPDLILMDINMPGCSGIEATRAIRQQLPATRVVMLTVSDEDDDLFEAIRCGAQGYLLKDLRPEELFTLLRGVQHGEAPLSPAVAAKMLREFTRQSKDAGEPASGQLSAREKEILQLVAGGASNKEIAQQLCITEGTVKNHLHNILDKLHLENRVQAAAYALREGLISQ